MPCLLPQSQSHLAHFLLGAGEQMKAQLSLPHGLLLEHLVHLLEVYPDQRESLGFLSVVSL